MSDSKTEMSVIIHFAVSLATGLQPLPKRVFQRLQFCASSFKFQYFSVFPHIIQKLLMAASSSFSACYLSFSNTF